MPYRTRSRRRQAIWLATAPLVVLIAGLILVLGHGSQSPPTTVRVAPKATSSTAAPTTTTTLVTYQVQRGDTLSSIAKHFGVSVASIVALDHLTNPDQIAFGQTLQIPPVPPIQLTVTPPSGPSGQGFDLKLVGAKPGETVTFEIDSPAGKYTGPPHPVAGDGTVSATYQTSSSDTPGSYTALAHGNQGTTAQASFRVDPATTTPTALSP